MGRARMAGPDRRLEGKQGGFKKCFMQYMRAAHK